MYILPKIAESRNVVCCDLPDIVCVVETWLSEEIASEVSIEGYDCFRHDRIDKVEVCVCTQVNSYVEHSIYNYKCI